MRRFVLLIAALAVMIPSVAGAAVPGDACTSEGSVLQEDPPDGNVHLICNGSVWVLWRTIDRVSATTGLVGWWKLDESAGTSAADSSGGGYVGTLTNGGTWQPAGGRIGGAIQLDGVNDLVESATGPDLSASDKGTLMAWVKNNVASPATKQGIVFKRGPTFEIEMLATGSFQSNLTNNAAWHNAVSSPVYADWNQWHHVASVYDGSNVRLYRDGVSTAEQFRATVAE